MIQHHTRNQILIISAEISSRHIDPTDWEALTLFGDGAAAAVIGKSSDGKSGVIKYKQNSYTKGYDKAQILGGGITLPFSSQPYDIKLHSFKMQGKELLRLTLEHIPLFMTELFSGLPNKWEDLDLVVPHQASKTGLNILNKIVDLKPSQIAKT